MPNSLLELTMAFSQTLHSPLSLSGSSNHSILPQIPSSSPSFSFQFSPSFPKFNKALLSIRSASVEVCDPKSLLFLYGLQLDYSDALIGGGFNFKNPNATKTCGCGKSFAATM